MTPEILTVTTQDLTGQITVITAAGDIDASSTPQLRGAADQALHRGRYRLVFDLAAVTFCDSSGLALFIDLHRATQTHDGWLHLAALPQLVQRILRITNLDQLFASYDTIEDAAADQP